ncbi:MAG: DUF4959 domain-containing protein [Bacteroidales bacterium]|nr:DUF4959 domain-containing protein [Bacteroidales bacterium]
MKKKNRKNSIQKNSLWMLAAGLCCVCLMSCSEQPIGQTPTDNTPPPQVIDVHVVPTNGGAYITYALPPDEEDISYVKCEFEYNGKQRTVRSSIYKNYMEVDGIGEPEEIELKISVVDHSGNVSVPHIEKFTPLDPPMTAIYRSFEVEPAFGGVKVSWENPAKVMAGISFLASNDYGELELKDMVFSSLPAGLKSLRGFNTDKRLFALSITDKYENVSDTFRIELEPLYEVMLDKSKFADAHLLGDNFSVNDGRPINLIWDGVNEGKWNSWHTDAAGGYSIPQHFSIDLGVTAQLTRVVIYNRTEDIYYYAQHNLRIFDVWGTDVLIHDITNPYYEESDWKEDWTLLAQCEIVKPSGSPPGTNTPEDIAAHNAGFEFEFRQDVPKMRYIRFEVHETWARTPAIHMGELSVFGDDR